MHDTGANVLLFLRRLLPTESDADLYEGFAMSVIQRYRTRACFGSKADICSAKLHVRFTPKSGHAQRHRLVRSTGTQSTRLTFALSGALLQQVMLGHARGKRANH